MACELRGQRQCAAAATDPGSAVWHFFEHAHRDVGCTYTLQSDGGATGVVPVHWHVWTLTIVARPTAVHVSCVHVIYILPICKLDFGKVL